MWFGLAMGYAYHYGFFKRIDMGANKATQLEGKWPFKAYVDKGYFMTAGGCSGGEILPSFMNQARNQNQEETKEEAKTNSANANFKAFAGKGTSIGGAPLVAAT